jgi:hypothetical protein
MQTQKRLLAIRPNRVEFRRDVSNLEIQPSNSLKFISSK